MNNFTKGLKRIVTTLMVLTLFVGFGIILKTTNVTNNYQTNEVKAEEVNYVLENEWFENFNANYSGSEIGKYYVGSLIFEKSSTTPTTYNDAVEIQEGIYVSYKQNDTNNSLYDLIVWSEGNIYAPEECGSFLAFIQEQLQLFLLTLTQAM